MTAEPLFWALLAFGAALASFLALSYRRLRGEIIRIQDELRALSTDSSGEIRSAELSTGKLDGLRQAINATLRQILFSSLKQQATHKRNIIATIAHDFRGPLSSIRGYTETLQEKMETLPAEQKTDCLEVILRNVSALDRIVSSSLALSKLDATVARPACKPFLAQDLMLALEERFALLAQEKGINLITTTEPSQALVTADYAMLERALVNLVENAITYTGAGKAVTVSVVQDAAGVEICVKDEGIGIAVEHLPHIFDEFYRVDKDRSRITGGAGLGLALVKKIIQAHGSQINVESVLGHGTVMRFRIGSLIGPV